MNIFSYVPTKILLIVVNILTGITLYANPPPNLEQECIKTVVSMLHENATRDLALRKITEVSEDAIKISGDPEISMIESPDPIERLIENKVYESLVANIKKAYIDPKLWRIPKDLTRFFSVSGGNFRMDPNYISAEALYRNSEEIAIALNYKLPGHKSQKDFDELAFLLRESPQNPDPFFNNKPWLDSYTRLDYGSRLNSFPQYNTIHTLRLYTSVIISKEQFLKIFDEVTTNAGLLQGLLEKQNAIDISIKSILRSDITLLPEKINKLRKFYKLNKFGSMQRLSQVMKGRVANGIVPFTQSELKALADYIEEKLKKNEFIGALVPNNLLLANGKSIGTVLSVNESTLKYGLARPGDQLEPATVNELSSNNTLINYLNKYLEEGIKVNSGVFTINLSTRAQKDIYRSFLSDTKVWGNPTPIQLYPRLAKVLN